MRVLQRLILALLLAVLVPAHPQAQEGGYQGAAVSVVKAEQRCVEDRVKVSGNLVAKSEVKIWSDRNGLVVAQVLVEPGDSVGAGQVLARLVEPAGAPPQNEAIKAPVAGVIVDVEATVGSYVSPNATHPLFRIVVDGELEMRGEVLAAVVSKLKVGQTAALQIMGFGPLDGHVTSVARAVDAETQQGSLRIAFSQDPRLRPGAFARADIATGQVCGVTVPLSAVLYGSGGEVVQVVRGDHIETRRVEIGLAQDGFVQIRDGVDRDDVVVARAGSFLREGDRVRPILIDPEDAAK